MSGTDYRIAWRFEPGAALPNPGFHVSTAAVEAPRVSEGGRRRNGVPRPLVHRAGFTTYRLEWIQRERDNPFTLCEREILAGDWIFIDTNGAPEVFTSFEHGYQHFRARAIARILLP